MVPKNEFGKEIQKKLIDLGKSQKWLVEEVRMRTGGFFDDSWLHRIMTGRTPCEQSKDKKSPAKAAVIREILDIE